MGVGVFCILTLMCLKKIWKSEEYVFIQMSSKERRLWVSSKGYTYKPKGLRMMVMAQGYTQQVS